MNAFQKSGGSRFPGLLFSGVVAGALSFALSAGGTSSSSSSSQNTDYGTSSGQYGLPSSDSGMSSPSSPGTGAAGTGSSTSGSGMGGTGSSSDTNSYGTGATGPSTGTPGTGVSGSSTGSGSSGTGMSGSSPGGYGSGATGASSSALPPNITPGWKIRVCSEKTKADQISFRFSMPDKGKTGMKSGTAGAEGTGTGGSGDVSANTASWSRGEATEINLPTEVRDASKIRIEATPSQKDKKSSVCLIYNDHVAKKLNFDDKEVSTVKTTDNGECGC